MPGEVTVSTLTSQVEVTLGQSPVQIGYQAGEIAVGMAGETVEVSTPGSSVELAAQVIVVEGPRGPRGDVAAEYEHVQTVASALWIVPHNLGRYPSVTVLTTGGVEVIASVIHQSKNVLNVLFDEPMAGSAICT